MTGAHGIDIELFHQPDIFYHAFTADVVSTIRIHLVTVNSLDEDRLPVDQQLLVFDFHTTETYFLRNDFQPLPTLLHSGDEGV